MRTAWRWFMIIGLILALPLQGAVAGTLRHCAPAKVQAVLGQQAHEHRHHHDGAALTGSGQDPAAAHGAGVPADGADAGQCSVCAACCGPAVVAALALPRCPVPVAGSTRYGERVALAPPEGLPDDLERPPRFARV